LATIVLIEDNPADVFLVRKALSENGIPCSLKVFETGREAVRIFCGPANEDFPVPEAILLDLLTPCTDGFDALSRLRQSPRLAEVPIAILTSSRSPGDKRRAANQGVRFIEKPCELDDFIECVGREVSEMLTRPDQPEIELRHAHA
jgi:CheY-like chemotaxis protein